MSKSIKRALPLLILMLITALVLGAIFIFALMRRSSLQSNEVPSAVKIMTSFYPLYYFTTQLGQPIVSAENITPAGSEPHDYEPTPQQIVDIQNSKMLVLNGGNFEPWAGRVTEQLAGSPVMIVESGDSIEDITTDPHVWLSPRLAQIQALAISDALIETDPTHQKTYQINTEQLLNQLRQLDQEYTKGLANCAQRSFVTSHAAFGHVADTYNLEQVPIAGLSPDEEPSSRQLAELSSLVKKNKIKYIFFETLTSPKLAQTLAQETGAQTLVLDPLEGLSQNQVADGDTYFTVMRQNLTNLRLALECQ